MSNNQTDEEINALVDALEQEIAQYKKNVAQLGAEVTSFEKETGAFVQSLDTLDRDLTKELDGLIKAAAADMEKSLEEFESIEKEKNIP